VAGVIPGFRNERQAKCNVRGGDDEPLTAEEIGALEAGHPLPPLPTAEAEEPVAEAAERPAARERSRRSRPAEGTGGEPSPQPA